MNFPLPSIGIVGLGQIGASLAKAIQKNQLTDELVGHDASEKTLRYCQEHKLIDSVMPLEAMAKQCNLIILAVPPEKMGSVISALTPHINEDTILTDVASVKLPVLRYLEDNYPDGINFIPGHPIAGGTKAGPEFTDGDIFARKLVMLTPPQGVDINDPALQLTQHFWQNLDTVVEMVPAEVHDLIYGYVSHLPHLMAYAASATLADASFGSDTPEHLLRFVRLGDSDAKLWTDITLSNQASVLQALRTYLSMLSHIREELAQGNEEVTTGDENAELAIHTLFPRIAASCLVATVNILERQAGQKLARYSGAGFADVASPASEAPEGDLEQISTHYRAVSLLLSQYEKQLEALASAIESGQPKQLLTLLEEMYGAHQQLLTRLENQKKKAS